MKTWRKWALGLLGGAMGFLLLGIGFLWLFFDWNWLRDPAARITLAQSGRELSIARIQGEWGWTPRIKLDDVHFGNAEWAQEEDMLAADRLEFVIDLRELIKGRLVLPEIMLDRPVLSIEREADGRANWSLAAKEAAAAAAPDERAEAPLIGRLAIRDGRLVYRDAKAGIDMKGDISTASGTGGGNSGDSLRFRGQGKLQGETFTLAMEGGSLLSLRESEEPYPLAIDITAGTSKAHADGRIQDPLRFEGVDLAVRLSGDNLARLTQLTGAPLPLTPPYELAARLGRDGAVWRLRELQGRMGQSDIAGDLTVDTGKPRLYLEANLNSQRVDYRDIGTLIGIPPAAPGTADADKAAGGAAALTPPPPKPARKNSQFGPSAKYPAPPPSAKARTEQAEAALPPPRVLPDAPLAAEQVREVDAKLRFRGAKVDAPNTPLEAVDLTLDLKDGVLRLMPLAVNIASGRAIADIRLDARDPRIRTDYDIRLEKFRLERFLADAGLPNRGHGRIDGRIKLTGYGDSVRRSLGSSNGDIRLLMSGGEMSNLALELVGLDAAQATGFLVGGDKNVPIRCMIGDIDVKDGTMTPRLFLLDTTDSAVTLEGDASLAQESLKLRLLAHPKDTSFMSLRSPITIGGYFGQPDVGIEPGRLGARTAGAVALGVLLTPLASALAFFEPGLQEDSNCQQLLAEHPIR